MKVTVDWSNACVRTAGMLQGIEMLFDSYRYAEELGRDEWDFAVEIEDLQAAGVNNAELRWLVGKGLAQHAKEVRLGADELRRTFQPVGDLTFVEGSCFVLSKEGFEELKRSFPRDRIHLSQK